MASALVVRIALAIFMVLAIPGIFLAGIVLAVGSVGDVVRYRRLSRM